MMMSAESCSIAAQPGINRLRACTVSALMFATVLLLEMVAVTLAKSVHHTTAGLAIVMSLFRSPRMRVSTQCHGMCCCRRTTVAGGCWQIMVQPCV